MPVMGRLCGALAVPFVLFTAAAEAQVGRSAPVEAGHAQAVPARPDPPEFRTPRGEYRARPGLVRDGLIGAIPFGRQPAIRHRALRWSPNFTAPRMEAADIRRRDRGIAAVGLSFRF